jgi:methionyl-tRNA formyltransferase
MVSLFLMSKKGLIVLQQLIQDNLYHHIDLVIIGTDKAVVNDYSNEILLLCNKFKIRAFLRGDHPAIESKYAIAISWRWMINGNFKLIVLHDSLLPKYRGFSPLVNQLLNGERETGVTALWADATYDTGDIITQRRMQVTYPVKISTLIDKLSELYISIAKELFESIAAGKPIKATKQDEKVATYSLWRNDKDYHIDWNQSSENIQRFVDAVGFPYAGAFAFVNNRRIRIFDVEETEDVYIENRQVGKVIFIKQENPVVVCGKGLLIIQKAFDEDGKSIIPLKNFRTLFE